MSNLEFSIPVEQTALQIFQSNGSLDEETAQALAVELHEIVSCMQKALELKLSAGPRQVFTESADAALTVLRSGVGFRRLDDADHQAEGFWVAGEIARAEKITGVKLYER
jgi:hypothetical protein